MRGIQLGCRATESVMLLLEEDDVSGGDMINSLGSSQEKNGSIDSWRMYSQCLLISE